MSSTDPTVIDPELSPDGERILLGAEREDVSLIVEAPSDIRTEELESILSRIPRSVERTGDLYLQESDSEDDLDRGEGIETDGGSDPGDRKTGHWSRWGDDSEEDPDSDPDVDLDDEEREQTVIDHIRERTDEMWDLRGVMIADRDDELLFLIVVRSGVGDSGTLLLDERYFTFDGSDLYGDGTGYSSNGITRRINGEGTLLGLRILYSSIADGATDGIDVQTQIMEAQNGGLQHNPEDLTEPIGDLLGIDAVEEETDSGSGSSSGSMGPVDQPDRTGWVRCSKCGETLPESDATQFSSGPPLGDVWVHPKGDCPDLEGDR